MTGVIPNTFILPERPHDEFQSIKDINNYLLRHPDVLNLINKRGGKPKAVFLMFDDETESLARQTGMDVWCPEAALRTRLDHKVETVTRRACQRAGVAGLL